MEEQVHEIKEAIINSSIVVNQIPNILEDQRDEIHPQTRTHQIFHIICTLDIERFQDETLMDQTQHYYRAHDQDGEPVKIAALVLAIVPSVVLYLQLDNQARLSTEVVTCYLLLAIL